MHIESVIEVTGHGDVASYPDFLDWRARNHVTDGMAAFRTGDFTLIGGRGPGAFAGSCGVGATCLSYSESLRNWGVIFYRKKTNPAAAGGVDPVILSYGLWQRAVGANVAVLNRTIQLGDQRFTVVGVMPKGISVSHSSRAYRVVDHDCCRRPEGPDRNDHPAGCTLPRCRCSAEAQCYASAEASRICRYCQVLNKQHPENKPRTMGPYAGITSSDRRYPSSIACPVGSCGMCPPDCGVRPTSRTCC